MRGQGGRNHVKVPLGALEEARANPTAFKAKLAATTSSRFFTFGRPQLIECAILRFHKRRMGADAARQYLIEWYQEKFGDDARLDEAIRAFEEYVIDLERMGLSGGLKVTRFMAEVALPRSLQDGFKVTGMVPRIDVTADGGYAAWLFAKKRAAWKDELRMPLLQAAVAARLGADVEDVTVGTYCFEEGRHTCFTFTEDECVAAGVELTQILEQLR